MTIYRGQKSTNKKRKAVAVSIIFVIIIFGSIAIVHSHYSKKGKLAPNNTSSITSNNSQNQSVKPESPVSDKTETPILSQTSTDKKTQPELSNEKIPILMYHHIRDFNDPNDKIGTNLSVSPSTFSAQLDLIKQKGYTAITFNDLANNKIPEKPIILTFDDGYLNFYQNAFPELKRRDMKAVSFIITSFIGGGDYMNAEQIKEISTYGIEIGSHTVSHPDLSTSSEKSVRTQIFDSKKTLESIISKSVISFCYPSGKYTSQTESIVKEAGYEFATTTKGGITTFGDFFALNRYRMNNDTSISAYIK